MRCEKWQEVHLAEFFLEEYLDTAPPVQVGVVGSFFLMLKKICARSCFHTIVGFMQEFVFFKEIVFRQEIVFMQEVRSMRNVVFCKKFFCVQKLVFRFAKMFLKLRGSLF